MHTLSASSPICHVWRKDHTALEKKKEKKPSYVTHSSGASGHTGEYTTGQCWAVSRSIKYRRKINYSLQLKFVISTCLNSPSVYSSRKFLQKLYFVILYLQSQVNYYKIMNFITVSICKYFFLLRFPHWHLLFFPKKERKRGTLSPCR